MPKKPQTRAKHDKTRERHIQMIYSLYASANMFEIGSKEWLEIMEHIERLEAKLKIYDKEMGYES